MPITTPESMLPLYGDDTDHFQNVLDKLFVPAVEACDLTPIPPSANGSTNIQADIIKNLEVTDLVLCDISCLNPNVFFEFGIRTALNLPVCLVKDDTTKRIPFDPGTINCHTYKSIPTWDVQKEVDKICAHIQSTIDSSEGKNPLWRYFGLTSSASPVEPKTGEAGELEKIQLMIESLTRKIDSKTETRFYDGFPKPDSLNLENFISSAKFILGKRKEVNFFVLYDGSIRIEPKHRIHKHTFNSIKGLADSMGIRLKMDPSFLR